MQMEKLRPRLRQESEMPWEDTPGREVTDTQQQHHPPLGILCFLLPRPAEPQRKKSDPSHPPAVRMPRSQAQSWLPRVTEKEEGKRRSEWEAYLGRVGTPASRKQGW